MNDILFLMTEELPTVCVRPKKIVLLKDQNHIVYTSILKNVFLSQYRCKDTSCMLLHPL